MGRLPPCDINRFVCLPIFDPRHPSAQGASAPSGTHLPAVHSASLESHHPVVLTGPPSLPASDLRLNKVSFHASDCDWTEVPLFSLPVIAFAADCAAPSES